MNRNLLAVMITLASVGSWFAVANINAQGVFQNSFGMTTQRTFNINPPPWDPVDHNILSAFVMDTIVEEGAGTVRLLFPWRQMESSQGVIDWAVQDLYVNAAVARGLNIHTMFFGVPGWSNNTEGCDFWTQSCSAPPSSYSHFYNFVRAVALRYGSAITTWELWNEPDLNTFWSGSMRELRNLITDPGIAAVKSVAGTSRVFVSPGFSWNTSKMKIFLDKTPGDWDFVGVHLFPKGDPTPYSWAVSKMTAYHNAKQSVGNSNKNTPFFITEAAIGTGNDGYTEMQMGDWACKLIQSIRWDGPQGDMRASHAILFFPWDGSNETNLNAVSNHDFTRKQVFYDIQDQLSPDKVYIPCGNSVQ